MALGDVRHCIAGVIKPGHRDRMNEDRRTQILALIARMPAWLRHDLGAKDEAVRGRAEETLAAMIDEALGQNNRPAA